MKTTREIVTERHHLWSRDSGFFLYKSSWTWNPKLKSIGPLSIRQSSSAQMSVSVAKYKKLKCTISKNYYRVSTYHQLSLFWFWILIWDHPNIFFQIIVHFGISSFISKVNPLIFTLHIKPKTGWSLSFSFRTEYSQN